LLPVAGRWGSVLAALIPLALVISLSPLSLIPAVLVLDTPRPRPTSLAFLAGWVLGLCALVAAFVAGSGLVGHLHNSPPTWASWLRIVLGSVLIAFGIYRWFTRHGHSESPRWLRSFSKLTPPRAAMTGAVLTAIRPEIPLITIAAGVNIGTGGFTIAGKVVCAAIYVAVAASSVAIPILAYAAAGHRLDDALARLKNWMEVHNAALLAAILFLIGLMVLHNGLKAL
jgi:hypothetical protein